MHYDVCSPVVGRNATLLVFSMYWPLLLAEQTALVRKLGLNEREEEEKQKSQTMQSGIIRGVIYKKRLPQTRLKGCGDGQLEISRASHAQASKLIRVMPLLLTTRTQTHTHMCSGFKHGPARPDLVGAQGLFYAFVLLSSGG